MKMMWLCVGLALALVLVSLAYLRLKRVLRQVTAEISELADEKTEKAIDLALVDRDLEQLAGALNRLNDRQRQTVATARRHEDMLKESVANISHDLRTPLTVILGHLQLLQAHPLPEDAQRRLTIIRRKAERMRALVENFYELSVLENTETQPECRPFNLTNLLLDLIAENGPALEARGIDPQIALPETSVIITSDRSMVARIIQNLLSNASRYSGGALSITLRAEADRVTLCFANNLPPGVTLTPSRLFERFYTGDPSRHNGSTGLGLAVVRLLAARLGGTVEAACDKDWLTVTVQL